jgi:hypothetical protein
MHTAFPGGALLFLALLHGSGRSPEHPVKALHGLGMNNACCGWALLLVRYLNLRVRGTARHMCKVHCIRHLHRVAHPLGCTMDSKLPPYCIFLSLVHPVPSHVLVYGWACCWRLLIVVLAETSTNRAWGVA